MVYLPGGMFGRVYRPCPSLLTVRVTPLPVATTFAPGTTAAEGSVTVPRTLPTFCAVAVRGAIPANTSAASATTTNLVTTGCSLIHTLIRIFIQTRLR